MIHELRLYSVAPGRMADVHHRFNEHFPALFRKHGVELVGRWNALAGPDAPRFVYLMAYRDYAHREAVWASFYGDAEWWRIRAETNAGHEMVERHDLFFLKPNAAWTVDGDAGTPVAGLYELVQQQIAPGQNANANVFLQQTWLPLVREAGARVMAVWDMAAGAGMQKVVLLYAWPDAAKWHAGRRMLDGNEALRAAFAEQRGKNNGTALFQRSEVNLLDPAPGATILAGLGRGAA
jgi:hypothetical protein